MSNHRAAGPLQIVSCIASLSLLVPGCTRTQNRLTQPAAAATSPAILSFVASHRAAAARPLPARAAVASARRTDGATVDPALEALRDAFVARDLEAYAARLSDGFVFRYRPEDVGPGEPDTMGRAAELRFADHVFHGGAASGAPAAERIELEFAVLERGPEQVEGGFRLVALTCRSHLRLHLPGGRVYAVDTPVRLRFRLEGAEAPVWRVVEWVELPEPSAVSALSPMLR